MHSFLKPTNISKLNIKIMDAPEPGLEILTEIEAKVPRTLTHASGWLLGFQAKGHEEKMRVQNLGL